MASEALDFELPAVPGRRWLRVADTAQASPNDFADPGAEPVVPSDTYQAQGRSVVVLVNRPA